MTYKIYHSAQFDSQLRKYDKDFQNRVDKIEDILVENPYTGSPLNVKWFREKRIDVFRVYYLIYDDLNVVFMVAISGKKDQQKVINTIWLFLKLFRNELEEILRNSTSRDEHDRT